MQNKEDFICLAEILKSLLFLFFFIFFFLRNYHSSVFFYEKKNPANSNTDKPLNVKVGKGGVENKIAFSLVFLETNKNSFSF